jgi:transposase-like protein
MNRLPLERRVEILGILVAGGSLRSASRLAGVSINTVTKLLVNVGRACEEFQVEKVVNLPCKRIQCDEIWSIGDAWTWTGICADTKIIASWLVADRSAEAARRFVSDLAGRLTSRVKVTLDGPKLYVDAVEQAFGDDVDLAQLVKHCGREKGAEKIVRAGSPDVKHVFASYVDRQNVTMRIGMRRFTRLTNGFSKKIENHCHAIALHFMHYNFARIRETLRVTPAMAAGVADRVWSLAEIADLAK